jgi:hypothetical protein
MPYFCCKVLFAMAWTVRSGALPPLNTSARPFDKFRNSASAIWERAAFPVHKNNTRRRSFAVMVSLINLAKR